MLRSTALSLAALLVVACGGVMPAASPTAPAASPTNVPTSGPTAAPTVTPSAAATTAPTGGAVSGACAVDWYTSAAVCDGEIGTRFLVQCPPGGRPTAIYGTDVYTDDSSICVAAVHAGLIDFDTGGSVTIEIRPGMDSYAGSERNGVDSSNWASWPTSFVFVAGPIGGPTPGSPFGTSSPELAPLLAHVPAAFNVNCHEVTTLSAGEVIAASCSPEIVTGYVTYVLFDTSANLHDKFFGDLDYFGEGAEDGRDCTVGPCLVAWERGGIVEGRYFANNYTGIDPKGLIAHWFDDGLLIEAGLVVYDTTFAELYSLALQAGPTP